VKLGGLLVVGPTGVAVWVLDLVADPPAPPVVTVPLDEAVDPPVCRMMEERVLEGQYVVVYVEV
jgi:hypothetical protein